ncbi:MAG: ATP-binding cassette domain-containing protein [Erysipelothrix sp.]|nr:ATP-binding cassette domain-containing protein [Erysipelothrix sp.]
MRLVLNNVHKSYGEHHVLKGISIEAISGRAMGLLGRNGSGKTTMIRSIMQVFDIDEGSISLPVTNIDEIGYLPEERGIYPKAKLIDQMIYFAMLKGLNKKTAKKRSVEWLEKIGLTDYANKKADTLSKGNQQKVQVAISLLHDPKVIILDEPFSGLDPVNSELLKDIVRAEIEKGKIVFFSSHQMANVEAFCDDIAILNKGNIVLQGDLNEIKKGYPREKIQFFSDDLDLLETQLRSIEFENFHRNNNSIVVKLKDNSDIYNYAKQLVNDLANINGYKIVEPTLDEIFIQYAKETI